MATALVFGGGGVTGVGWHVGMLAGLAAAGLDLSDADVVIGTSAGSVAGAMLRSGTDLETLYARQLEPPSAEVSARIGARQLLGYGRAMLKARHDKGDTAEALGRALGEQSLAAQRHGHLPTLQARRAALEARLTSLDWPERELRITAVDAHTGRLRVFTREDAADGVTLLDALTASCAVPNVYPPVPIGGHTYIDGGVRTAANADLAAGCDRVIAFTPILRAFGASTASELAALGVPHLQVSPDDAARAAIGSNVLDARRRAAAAAAGRRQANDVVAQVATIWRGA